MKILVHRKGSGWGGVVCKWLIDTTEGTQLNCEVCFKSHNFECTYNCIACPSYPHESAILKSKLELNLPESTIVECKLADFGLGPMDFQTDELWVKGDSSDWRKICDSDWGTYPEDINIRTEVARIIDLFDNSKRSDNY